MIGQNETPGVALPHPFGLRQITDLSLLAEAGSHSLSARPLPIY
jgi:hypothetical protein